MKAIITGGSGTVGAALRAYLQAQGMEVVTWERSLVPIDNYHEMESFVRRVEPDLFFHLAIASQSTGRTNESWLVNYEWTSELAWITRKLRIKFIYTSTVMVFSDEAKGPFTVTSRPDAREGYGYEKRLSEGRVFYQNPHATIVRLGWQIGERPGSNNMLDYLEKQMAERGRIEASTRWYPACSFIKDTVMALYGLAALSEGLYQLDSNERWSFYEIVCALKELHRADWEVVPTEHFVYDQRMIDERIKPPSLKQRLPSLK